MITPKYYLLLSTCVFTIGIMVTVARRQPLLVLLGIELMLQAVSLVLAALTGWFQDWSGEIAVLAVVAISIVELAVGLGSALAYRHHPPTVRQPRP